MPATQQFQPSPRGYVPIARAAVQTAAGRLSLLVALARARTCAVAERHAKATRRVAATCLRALMAAGPSTRKTVLTDTGTPFTARAHVRRGAATPQDAQPPEGVSLMQACDAAGAHKGIAQRLTKPGHPWTNGQVERLNRTRQEATVTRYAYDTHRALNEPLDNFLTADHVAKRLNTLQGLTPDDYLITGWQKDPDRLKINPCQHTLGLNIQYEGDQKGSRKSAPYLPVKSWPFLTCELII